MNLAWFTFKILSMSVVLKPFQSVYECPTDHRYYEVIKQLVFMFLDLKNLSIINYNKLYRALFKMSVRQRNGRPVSLLTRFHNSSPVLLPRPPSEPSMMDSFSSTFSWADSNGNNSTLCKDSVLDSFEEFEVCVCVRDRDKEKGIKSQSFFVVYTHG